MAETVLEPLKSHTSKTANTDSREFALEAYKLKLAEATGIVDSDYQILILAQILGILYGTDTSNLPKVLECRDSIIDLLSEIKPKDGLEGMLIAQMIGTHHMAMNFLRAASDSKKDEQEESKINLATKLLRTYAAQMETLGRYRNKGKQKVTVEHVHVNSGGQAIVGVIDDKPGEGKG